MLDYSAFLAGKAPRAPASGLQEVPPLNPALKPFQAAITSWALRRGRAAVFAGTGLGKTLMQLDWARVVAEEYGNVLILCPLAVAEQTVAEAQKFGIEGVAYAADQSVVTTDIVVTNYERFEKFDITRFAGIVLDESGIIKSHDGKTRKLLTESCRDVPWKLCCSATPAPNDYTELGQHAEFLNVMDAKEMLAMFFVHDGSIRAGDATQGHDGWRMKRHAAADFWRWLASWSVMVRHPADLGFDEPGYDLPPLNLHQVTVKAEYRPTAGELFPMMANTLSQRIGVRRDTAYARVLMAKDIIDSGTNSNKLSACYPMKPKNGEDPQPEIGMQTIPSETRRSRTLPSSPEDRTQGENTNDPITTSTRKNSARDHRSSATGITRRDASDTQMMQNTKSVLSDAPERSKVELPTRSAAGELNSNLDYRNSNTTPSSHSNAADARSAGALRVTAQDADSTLTIAIPVEMSEVSYAPPAILGSESSEIIQRCSPKPLNTSIVPDPASWVVWCNLNKEQDALAKQLGDRCFSVYGSLPADEKVSRIMRWVRGERPILLSKPSICGHGLNLQRCHQMAFVGLTDSFEQVYQAIRRSWRFGQTRPVEVYFIASELEGAVVANLKHKEQSFDLMLDAMSVHMRDLQRENVLGGRNASEIIAPRKTMELPAWLTV